MITNPSIGLRVVTNNLDWGSIESRDAFDPNWFEVRLDNGRLELQDLPRMSLTHPFGDLDPAPFQCDYCPNLITEDLHEHGGLCVGCRDDD